MKKLLLIAPLIAFLTACGSTSDPYEKRANAERERQETYVQNTIKKAPDWMIKTPISNSAVYASGSAVSSDYSNSVHYATMRAGAKICMSAGGTLDQRSKMYMAENETGGSQLNETVIRSSCKGVDITGFETSDVKVIPEGNRFRAYVLIVLPTGDANVLRKAKEQAKMNEMAAARAPEAFKELDR